MAIPEAPLEVTADFLTVRTFASVYAPKMGYLVKGNRVRVLETKPGPGSAAGWVRVQVDVPPSIRWETASTQPLRYPVTTTVDGWLSLDFLAPIAPPPPIEGRWKMRMGVNVITGDEGVALRALAAGCTAISGINMFGQLSALAALHKDKTFMARRYISSYQEPDPDLLFEGAGSPDLWYLCPNNECDVICNGTPEQIERRAWWDGKMWEKMKRKGRRYAGFSFSVGTAEYTNPAVVAAMRKFYKPLYDDGMGFNGHFYSPWRGHKMDEWYEGRANFLYGDGPMSCGFSRDPKLAGVFSDEMGLDEGSLGGAEAAGWSPAQVEDLTMEFMSYNDHLLGGLFRAAVWFQAGDKGKGPGHWGGYHVGDPDYLAAIGRAAQAPIRPYTVARTFGPSAPPVMFAAPRKVLAMWEGAG